MGWVTRECCDCGNMVFLHPEKEQCKNCEDRDTLRNALRNICRMLEDSGGTVDQPKRITWDVAHQVYDIAVEALRKTK